MSYWWKLVIDYIITDCATRPKPRWILPSLSRDGLRMAAFSLKTLLLTFRRWLHFSLRMNKVLTSKHRQNESTTGLLSAAGSGANSGMIYSVQCLTKDAAVPVFYSILATSAWGVQEVNTSSPTTQLVAPVISYVFPRSPCENDLLLGNELF